MGDIAGRMGDIAGRIVNTSCPGLIWGTLFDLGDAVSE
jgi:hypothetical protein